MACIDLTVNPVTPALLRIAPAEGVTLAIQPAEKALLIAKPIARASLKTVVTTQPVSLVTETVKGVKLTISGVCSVSGGTIVVLAASDGPLRTKNGGYFLLNPATNPPE